MYEKSEDNKLVRFFTYDLSKTLLVESLRRYISIIEPKATPGNNAIREEIKQLNRIMSIVRKTMGNSEDIILLRGDVAILKSAVTKYGMAYRRELEDKKKYQTVDGEFEGDEKKLEEMNNMLSWPIFNETQSARLRVEDFYSRPTGLPEDTMLSAQINIGQIIGQSVIGTNFGQLNQSLSIQIIHRLQEINNIVTESKEIGENDKGIILSSVQTIQTQMMSPVPDKGIVEKAWDTLNKVILLYEGKNIVKQIIELIKQILPLIQRQIPGLDSIKSTIA